MWIYLRSVLQLNRATFLLQKTNTSAVCSTCAVILFINYFNLQECLQLVEMAATTKSRRALFSYHTWTSVRTTRCLDEPTNKSKRCFDSVLACSGLVVACDLRLAAC